LILYKVYFLDFKVNRKNRSYTHSIDNKQYTQYLRITSEEKIQTVFGVDVGGGVV
jgi:hypothetical protein